ncbi:MAG: DUF4249 family protein [Bacteroidales bacterium]|nr:DUF4249 family protein [Bacteroidales bacterium]
MKRLFLPIILACLFSACQVDFSPNASWKEIPVVYCVLDQDDSISIVRVQRAFLGVGNQNEYLSVFDSINYPEGSIEVKLLEWPAERGDNGLLRRRSNTTPRREFLCQYTLLNDKEDGSFAAPLQPAYTCVTKGQLDTASVYQLLVIDSENGDTLASAETYLVGNCNDMASMLTKPNNMDKFNFSGAGGNKTCIFLWYSLPYARQYQPYVNFAYKEFYRHLENGHWDTVITPHSFRVDWPAVKCNFDAATQTCRLSQAQFMAVVRDSVLAYQSRHDIDPHAYDNDPTTDYTLVANSTIDIYITACNEDLAAYIHAQEQPDGLNQERFEYTNIHGGMGIFASRRTHLRFNVPVNDATTGGYIKGLKDLDVGF